jgi:hypothetical protein
MYLPSDPWANRPIDTKSNPLEGTLVGFVAGLIFLPLGVFTALSDYRKFRGSGESDSPVITFYQWIKNSLAEKSAPKKPCPYCHKQIRADSYGCEHCGRDLPTS